MIPMNDPQCNLCSRKLSEHTYQESLDCAMKLIKGGRKKLGISQHKLRQSMSYIVTILLSLKILIDLCHMVVIKLEQNDDARIAKNYCMFLK